MATNTMVLVDRKRKREVDTDKILRTRYVFNDDVATPTIDIPASSVPFETTLLEVLGTISRLARPRPYDGSDNLALWAGFYLTRLLLEETSTNKHSLQHTSYVTLNIDDYLDYKSWYDRNVVNGSQQILLLEVRVHRWGLHCVDMEGAQRDVREILRFYEILKTSGEGRASLLPSTYKLIEFDDLRSPYDEVERRQKLGREWHPVHLVENVMERSEPHTSRYFTARTISNPARDGGCDFCKQALEEQGLVRPGKKALKKRAAMQKREAEQAGQKKSLTVHEKRPTVELEDEDKQDTGTTGAGWERCFALHEKKPRLA